MCFLILVFLSALNDTFIVVNAITLMVRTDFFAITDWTIQHCYIRQRWWLHNSVNLLFEKLSFKAESVEGSNVPQLASTILFITSLLF